MSSTNEKWVFILNPVAGGGLAKKYQDILNDKIKTHQLNAEIVLTERKGHATKIATEFIDKGFNHIVAVGGDGTLNEIVRGIVDKENITLGIIAAGTGNDFIQILGFEGEFKDSDWDVFFEKKTIKMDIGKCNDNYFLNGMGLGFDAQVASENYTEDGEVKEGSSSKYLWHILKTLIFYKEHEMMTISNGKQQQSKCFINTIANGRRFAGQYFLTPKALANDGLLDVCMIKELSFLQRVGIFLKVPKGEHLNNPNVNYYQTDKLVIEFDNDVPHHLDGELFFASKFEVTIIPEKLNFIYNPNGKHYFK
jgi:diacylglycerol kinase (ATP)